MKKLKKQNQYVYKLKLPDEYIKSKPLIKIEN